MSVSSRTIAVFDFDGTLVKGDSFFPFLCRAAGYSRAMFALVDGLILYAIRRWNNRHDPALADFRTFLKTELLKRTIKGMRLDSLRDTIAHMIDWAEWIEPMRQKLLEHKSEGHHIVVASGGLDIYLHELFKGLPIDNIICTTLGIRDGVITGEMTSGNCVRERKAELVADYMKQHGPFDDSWGYGNTPHDLPMLNLLRHRIII